MPPRPPLPPFTAETATIKVKAAEDAWNSRDPERVAGAYTEDSIKAVASLVRQRALGIR
jgi:hypothetical protein